MKLENIPSETIVYKTTDYDRFKKLEGNRDLNKGLLVQVHESVENDGNYLQHNHIIVNEKWEVIDGQHRLKVAEEAEKEIYYTIAPGFGLREAQILNSRKRQWTGRDFLRSYIYSGNKNYQELSEIMIEYHFSIAICVKALAKDISHDSAMKRFRAGTFEIRDRAFGENLLGLLSTIRDHSPDYCYAQSACQRAVKQMLEKMADPKVFEKALIKYQTTVTRRNSEKDYLKQFQLILDAGGDNKIRLI